MLQEIPPSPGPSLHQFLLEPIVITSSILLFVSAQFLWSFQNFYFLHPTPLMFEFPHS